MPDGEAKGVCGVKYQLCIDERLWPEEGLTNDQAGHVGKRVRHIVRTGVNCKRPTLPVGECLNELFLLPSFVLDTGTLTPQPFNSNDPFLLGKEVGGHGVVRYEEPEADTDDKGEETRDEHIDFPGRDDVGVDVVHSERDDTIEYLSGTVHQEPLRIIGL